MSDARPTLPPGYRNCHARGIHSVVLAKYDDGRPRLRMFVATEDHELWRNDAPGCGDARMSLAIHAHRSPLTLTRIQGNPMQVEACPWSVRPAGPGESVVSLGRWRYRSQILTGHGQFTLLGSERFVVRKPYVFDCIRMEAADLHTIYVPRGEYAAWTVHEHALTPSYDEVLYSDDDLSAFDFAGMYEPMTKDEAGAVIARAFGGDRE